ncbi:hypothetical protein [Gimesia maris]|uniref:hypothetical protein n=1 Tax=Gimesia maris TaxID=122 RepID=UPI003A8DA444
MRKEDKKILGTVGWEYKHDGWSQMTTAPCFIDPKATLDQLKAAIEDDTTFAGFENNHAFVLSQYQAIKYRPRLIRAIRVPIKAYVFEDGIWNEHERFPMKDADEVTDVSYYQQEKEETTT